MRKVGDEAPQFDLPTSTPDTGAPERRRFRLADHRERWVVVYFFPKAFTPACAREAVRFRDNGDELTSLGADVVGISTDVIDRQCEFADKLQLTFPLASDVGGHVARAYGVLWPLIGIAQRATFIIGPAGVAERPDKQLIEAVYWHEVQVNKHLDDVVGYLRKQATHARSA
jgi:peroxiredoxin Q/BCP